MTEIRRLRSCVEAWPDCEEGAFDPSCCRFPKSCSCTVYDPARVTDADLEPASGRNTPVSTPSGPSAGLEGQDATQETQDATEAAQRRVGRIETFAEAILQQDAETCIGLDDLIPEDRDRAMSLGRAAFVVADQEQAEKDATIAELRAEVVRLRWWKAEALPVMSGLQDVGRALGLQLGVSITGESALDAALDLHNRTEAAEARVAELEATVAEVRELADGWGEHRGVSGWQLHVAKHLRAILDAPKDTTAP